VGRGFLVAPLVSVLLVSSILVGCGLQQQGSRLPLPGPA